jgi:hypothetical protein
MHPVQSQPAGEARRWRSLGRGCLASAAALAMTAAALGAGASTPLTPDQRAAFKPIFTTVKHAPIDLTDLDRQAAIHRTIPFWGTSIVSPVDGKTYTYTMVGKSPYALHPSRTFIHYVPIVARIHFPDGTVLDPTLPSACDTVSTSKRFYQSPLFKKGMITSNGVDVSGPNGEQATSAFQRANFWASVQGTNYGVDLEERGQPIVVDITAPSDAQVFNFPIQCPSGATVNINLGAIDINEFDSIVETTIAPLAKPNELPVFLSYDVVETAGGCCIIGYHNAVPVTNGTQTYAVGAYTDPGIFTAAVIHDIYPWSHEMGEWMDDPFVQGPFKGGRHNNITPAWGGTGQQSGCQNNLEVGDPLTGISSYTLVGGNGFTYTLQDLANKDWFYRTPSEATGGAFSFQGTFTTDAGPVCTG